VLKRASRKSAEGQDLVHQGGAERGWVRLARIVYQWLGFRTRVLASFVILIAFSFVAVGIAESQLKSRQSIDKASKQLKLHVGQVGVEIGHSGELLIEGGFEPTSNDDVMLNIPAIDGFFDVQQRRDVGDYKATGPVTDKVIWAREHEFYNGDIYWRIGEGPDIRAQSGTGQVNGIVKVLVISDSNLYGNGVADLETVWANRLETELNRQRGAGAFEVRILAQGGASLMQYADWMASGVVEEYDPDVIVIGYTQNDPMPSGFERALCGEAGRCEVGNAKTFPLYRECISGSGSAFATLVRVTIGHWFPNVTNEVLARYCDITRLSNSAGIPAEEVVATNLEKNPYLPYFYDAAAKIRELSKDRPLLVARTSVNMKLHEGSLPYVEILRNAGMEIIKMDRAEELYERFLMSPEAMYVHPADPHPGPLLTFAYALDVAEHLLELFGEDFTGGFGKRPAVQRDAPHILSGYLPARTLVVGDPRRDIRVVLPPSDRDIGQQVPCAFVGRPHLRIIFDVGPGLGSRLRLTLERSVGGPMTVQSSGYDQSGFRVDSPVRVINPGESFEIIVSDELSNVLFGSLQGGCGIGERTITLEPAQVRITKLS
jgi:hypothetical protein